MRLFSAFFGVAIALILMQSSVRGLTLRERLQGRAPQRAVRRLFVYGKRRGITSLKIEFSGGLSVFQGICKRSSGWRVETSIRKAGEPSHAFCMGLFPSKP